MKYSIIHFLRFNEARHRGFCRLVLNVPWPAGGA